MSSKVRPWSLVECPPLVWISQAEQHLGGRDVATFFRLLWPNFDPQTEHHRAYIRLRSVNHSYEHPRSFAEMFAQTAPDQEITAVCTGSTFSQWLYVWIPDHEALEAFRGWLSEQLSLELVGFYAVPRRVIKQAVPMVDGAEEESPSVVGSLSMADIRAVADGRVDHLEVILRKSGSRYILRVERHPDPSHGVYLRLLHSLGQSPLRHFFLEAHSQRMLEGMWDSARTHAMRVLLSYEEIAELEERGTERFEVII